MTNKRYAKSIKFDNDKLLDNNFSELLLSLDNKIHSGEFKVTVYGLGHVGSPIAAAWLRAGASVIGVDKSKLILHNAREGKTHIPEPGVSNIYEGRAIEDIEERYPGIISGYGKKSLEIGTKIFSLIYKKGIISMSSIKSGETEKLFEGVYRDVNIALSNELAIFSERLGINFWEARHAANSQPFCNIHKPGIGVGGACIPVYPQFILKTAKVLQVDCNLTKYSRLLNNSMPKYCVRQALRLIQPKKIRNSTITLLGLAFRGGVSDTRLSPTYDVIKELQKLKVKEIRIHDPLVKKDNFISNYINTFLFNELSEAIKGADLIMVIADHEEYKKLNNESLKNIALYDGRGIINIDNIILDKYSSIGNIQ